VSECVYVTDDEAMVRRFLKKALDHAGMVTKTFASGGELLGSIESLEPGVILLDIRMPEMNGLQVLEAMGAQTKVHAVLILSSHGDVSTAVQAIHAGAIDFIEKPFSTMKLIERIRDLQELVAARKAESGLLIEARSRIKSLTEREMQVGQEIAAGLSNKEAARKLGISPRTVEAHRANLIRKLKVSSIADIVRLFDVGNTGK
jgi:two-component system response regulator FixJ